MTDESTTGEQHVIVQDEADVRIVTLNRPARANAIAPETSRQLAQAFVDAEDDDHVRAIILTGTGDRHFCAGADLRVRTEEDRSSHKRRPPMRGLRRSLFEIVLESLKPTIAAINGAAYGGGLELSLCCDMRVASEAATFCLPEARRGLSAHYGTVLLPQVVSRGVSFEMLYTGAPIDSARALDCGLVNQVVPDGEALAAGLRLARIIAANAPLTVRRIKETVGKAHGLPTALALRLNEGPSPLDSRDSREGARAFVERRPPQWQGR